MPAKLDPGKQALLDDLNLTGRIQGSLGAGIAQATGAGLKALSVIPYTLDIVRYGGKVPYSLDETVSYRAADAVENFLTPRPEDQLQGFGGQVVTGLGQVGGFAAEAAASPLAGLASLVGSGISDHLSSAQEGDATSQQKQIETATGVVSGASELLPFEAAEAAWKASSALPLPARIAITGLASAIPNAAQEGAQRLWQNISKKYLSEYAPDTKLSEGTWEEAAVGGVVGAITGGLPAAIGVNPNVFSDKDMEKLQRDFANIFNSLPPKEQERLLQEIERVVGEDGGLEAKSIADLLDEETDTNASDEGGGPPPAAPESDTSLDQETPPLSEEELRAWPEQEIQALHEDPTVETEQEFEDSDVQPPVFVEREEPNSRRISAIRRDGIIESFYPDSGDPGLDSGLYWVPANEEQRKVGQLLLDAWANPQNKDMQGPYAYYIEQYLDALLVNEAPSFEQVQKDIENFPAYTFEETRGARRPHFQVTRNGLIGLTEGVKFRQLDRTTRTGQRIQTEVTKPTVKRQTLESMIARKDVRKSDKQIVQKLLDSNPKRTEFNKEEVLQGIKKQLPPVRSLIVPANQAKAALGLLKKGIPGEADYVTWGAEGLKHRMKLHLLTSSEWGKKQYGERHPHFSKDTVAHGRFYDVGGTRVYLEIQQGQPGMNLESAFARKYLDDLHRKHPDSAILTNFFFSNKVLFSKGYSSSEMNSYLTDIAKSIKQPFEKLHKEWETAKEKAITKGTYLQEGAARLIIQDAIKRAKEDGMSRVLFPTEASMPVAEGWLVSHVRKQDVPNVPPNAERLLKKYDSTLVPVLRDEDTFNRVSAAQVAYGRTFDKLLRGEFEAKVVPFDNRKQGIYTWKDLPYFEIKTDKVKGGSVEFFSGIPVGPMLSQAVQWLGFKRRDIQGMQSDVDKFNTWMDLASSLYRMAQANKHIPEVQEYLRYGESWNLMRTTWIDRADETLSAWDNLGKKVFGPIRQTGFIPEFAAFLFDRQKRSGMLGRKLSPQESADLAQTYGLDENYLQLMERIDGDFDQVLTDLQEILEDRARRTYKNNTLRMREELIAVQGKIAQLRNQNYFPLSRFGDYRVSAVATKTFTHAGETYAEGDLIFSEFFESEQDQVEAWQMYRREFEGKAEVKGSKIASALSDLVGLPPALLEVIRKDLNLTPEQSSELDSLVFKYAPGQSFVKHLAKRRNVEGFSHDASRAYASYMLKVGNYLARAKYGFEMGESLKKLLDSAQSLKTPEEVNKRTRIYEWLKEHRDYLLNPENELSNIRAMVFLWYLGGSPRAILMNLSQPWAQGWPVLAARYGDAKAAIALTAAYKTATTHLHSKTTGDPQLDHVLQQLKDENKLDQSLATMAAAVADGKWMSSLPNKNSGDAAVRLGQDMVYYLTLGFKLAESLNRRAVAIAAFNLEMKKSGNPYEGYRVAKDLTINTNFDTSRFNRPKYMRGRKSIFTVLLPYVHFAASNMMGAQGAAAAFRMWAVMLAMTGLEGMLGYEFVTAFWDFLRNHSNGIFPPGTTKADIHRFVRDKVGEHVELIRKHPDLVMHGAARYGFGLPALLQRIGIAMPVVDMSGSLGMGNWPPGGDMLRARDFDSFTQATAESFLGAGFAIPMQALRALMSDDPNEIKRLEMASPTMVRSLLKGSRYLLGGQETDYTGAVIVGNTPEDRIRPAEAVATAMNFTLQRVRQKQELSFLAREQELYVAARRTLLMRDYFNAQGKEEAARVAGRIDKYNKQVVDMGYRSMAIFKKDLLTSVKSRYRNRATIEAGFPGNQRAIPIHQDIFGEEALPEGVVHEEKVK